MYKIEYDLVASEGREWLINQVNSRLMDGWDLRGPPFYQGECWIQAVTRTIYTREDVKNIDEFHKETAKSG